MVLFMRLTGISTRYFLKDKFYRADKRRKMEPIKIERGPFSFLLRDHDGHPYIEVRADPRKTRHIYLGETGIHVESARELLYWMWVFDFNPVPQPPEYAESYHYEFYDDMGRWTMAATHKAWEKEFCFSLSIVTLNKGRGVSIRKVNWSMGFRSTEIKKIQEFLEQYTNKL